MSQALRKKQKVADMGKKTLAKTQI